MLSARQRIEFPNGRYSARTVGLAEFLVQQGSSPTLVGATTAGGAALGAPAVEDILRRSVRSASFYLLLAAPNNQLTVGDMDLTWLDGESASYPLSCNWSISFQLAADNKVVVALRPSAAVGIQDVDDERHSTICRATAAALRLLNLSHVRDA